MTVEVQITERYVDLTHGRTRILEAGSGYPTLLVHGAGFLSTADNWRPVIPALASQLRVIAVDCLNYGFGDVLNQEFSFAYMVDHLREVMDALGIEKANVIGHSMGGWLATLLAYESPQRLNRLVVVAAGGSQARPLASMVDWQPPSEDTIRETASPTLAPADRQRLIEGLLVKRARPEHVEAFAKVMRHMTNPETRVRYNTLRRLKHIPAPALILWGSNDQVNDISMAHDLADGIPDAQLLVYAGVGHGLPQEAPDRFTRDVIEFLGR